MNNKRYETKIKRLKNQLKKHKDNKTLYENIKSKLKTLENSSRK